MESPRGKKISRQTRCLIVPTIFNHLIPLIAMMMMMIAGQYPALPPPSDFCWALACSRREKEARMWKKEEESRITVTCPTAHYAAVRLLVVKMNSLSILIFVP